LPVANGGTGTSTPSLIGGTNITISGSFPNQTVTATGGGVTSLNGQTGAITDTNLYAIGSYVIGRPNNVSSDYAVNSTIAGSSLYAVSSGVFWRNDTSNFGMAGYTVVANSAHVNTGTWRCVSPAQGNYASGNFGLSGLWVRIS
jgi:hypothetical protein